MSYNNNVRTVCSCRDGEFLPNPPTGGPGKHPPARQNYDAKSTPQSASTEARCRLCDRALTRSCTG